jgi:hypothetical protein
VEPPVEEPLFEEPPVVEPPVVEPPVEEPQIDEPLFEEPSIDQQSIPGALPLLVSQLMQISPTQILSLTGPQLAELSLNIVGLPIESLANLSAAQVGSLSNVQVSALSLRMASLPPFESLIGNSSVWPETMIGQQIRTLDPNPSVSIQNPEVPNVNALIYSSLAQPTLNRLNLETPTRAIEVMPQTIYKVLMPGELLYQLVKTGSENAGLEEFLQHHLAAEAVGLVSSKIISGKNDLASSVNELFSQSANGPISLSSIVEDNMSASCRTKLAASDQPSAVRVFEGVILLNLNTGGQIVQLSFIDDQPDGSASPTRTT